MREKKEALGRFLTKPPAKECTEEMKKQKQAASGQAGAEVMVTPEMIRAGLEYLWDSGRLDFESETDRLYIEGIIEAVFKAGGFSVRTHRGLIRVQ